MNAKKVKQIRKYVRGIIPAAEVNRLESKSIVNKYGYSKRVNILAYNCQRKVIKNFKKALTKADRVQVMPRTVHRRLLEVMTY
jgi:hypothetical protein